MNAVTKVEVRAIESAAMLEVADPTKNLILVPLSQLLPRRSKRNARTTPRLSIPELAASISRVGLLQNLIVILAANGEQYEVVAGDRRLTALKLLAKKKRIATDYEAPCLLVPDASARTVSLAENLLREQMHPADQFIAFAALVKEGRPIEDIAADFGVSPLVVQRRLKLANISRRLMIGFRAGEVTLEQLMALTISDDHAAQEAAFYDAPEWKRGASALRERLTERELSASHPLAVFVGLEAYRAAGGGTRRDLFAEDDSGTYLTDSALLEALARDKLEALADDVRAECWTWVHVMPHMSHADWDAFRPLPRERCLPTAREARLIELLRRRLDRTDAALKVAADGERTVQVARLQERREQVADRLRALEVSLLGYLPDVQPLVGAIVTIDRNGEAAIHRGWIREADVGKLRTLQRRRKELAHKKCADGADGGKSDPQPFASLSDRLAQRLSTHRTAALQIEVARHPQVALAALVHRVVRTVLQHDTYGDGLPLGVRLTVQDRLEVSAPDWPDSPAAVALRQMRQAAGETLPTDSAELFAALLSKTQDELLRLLAVCVAVTVDAVTLRAAQGQTGTELARAVGLDMAAWWKPTAEGYFRHVPKAAILQAVAQFAPSHVTRLSKLKKADIASEAERLAEGTGWMPAVFEIRHDTKSQEADGESDAPEEAADHAQDHALAA